MPVAHGSPGFVVSYSRDGATPHNPGLGLEGGYCSSQAPSSLEVAMKKANYEKGQATEPLPMVNGQGAGRWVIGDREG